MKVLIAILLSFTWEFVKLPDADAEYSSSPTPITRLIYALNLFLALSESDDEAEETQNFIHDKTAQRVDVTFFRRAISSSRHQENQGHL